MFFVFLTSSPATQTTCSVFFSFISIRWSYFGDLTFCSVALGSACHANQPHNCLKKTLKREGRGYRIPRHHFTFWWFLTMMAAEVVLPAVRPCNESQPGIDPAEKKKISAKWALLLCAGTRQITGMGTEAENCLSWSFYQRNVLESQLKSFRCFGSVTWQEFFIKQLSVWACLWHGWELF